MCVCVLSSLLLLLLAQSREAHDKARCANTYHLFVPLYHHHPPNPNHHSLHTAQSPRFNWACQVCFPGAPQPTHECAPHPLRAAPSVLCFYRRVPRASACFARCGRCRHGQRTTARKAPGCVSIIASKCIYIYRKSALPWFARFAALVLWQGQQSHR